MPREVRGGARLAVRRWPSVLTLAAMVGFGCIVLSLVLGDFLSQLAVLRGGEQLRTRDAVVFTPYYARSGVSRVGDATVEALISQIRRGEAYSAIVHNVQIEDPHFADGNPTIVLFGDVLPSIFRDLDLCDPAPCAMRGSALAGQRIRPIDFVGEHLDAVEVLRPSATFFDANAAALQLDHRIVLRLPAEDLAHVNPIEREEALTRTVLLAPSAHWVDAFVAGSARGGLYLVPHEIAVDPSRRFQMMMTRSAVYIVGLAGFLGLALSAFASAAALTLRRELPSFTIRRMYGGAPRNLSIRVGAFLAVSMLALPVPLLLLLLLAGDPLAGGARWVLVLVITFFVFLWISSMRHVQNHDLMGR